MTEPKPQEQYTPQQPNSVKIDVTPEVAQFVNDVLTARSECRSRMIERFCGLDLLTLSVGRILAFERGMVKTRHVSAIPAEKK